MNRVGTRVLHFSDSTGDLPGLSDADFRGAVAKESWNICHVEPGIVLSAAKDFAAVRMTRFGILIVRG